MVQDIHTTERKYKIIYADPPWQFRTYSAKGQGRSAERHYPTMPKTEIQALPVSRICEKDCVLFLWVTAPCLIEGIELIKAWGFTYTTVAFTWIKKCKRAYKIFTGMGYYTRSNAEYCLIATKGKGLKRKSRSVSSVIMTPIEEHSNQCESLIGVRINKNLNNIGTSVFGSCIRLAEIINESSVDTKTLLGDKTGAITDRLLVNKNGGTSQIEKENGFYVFEGNNEKILIAPIDKTIENAILPDGVTVIRRNAFSYCKNLKSVQYPSTIKTVEQYAFRDCNKLKEISADDVAVISSVEYEDSSAFGSNLDLVIKGEKITELVIPASVKEIKDYTFRCFSRISSVRFDGAITLGKSCFSKKTKFVHVNKIEMLSGDIKESELLNRPTTTLLIEEDTSKVYCYCNESRWAQLSDERKAPANGKTVYYYSETQPATSGNYWHFDDNGAVKEW